MFELDLSKKESRLRVPALFAASVAAHVVVLAVVFGAFAYRTASRLAMFELDDDPTYTSRFKVAKYDPTKPLYLPPPPSLRAVKDVKPLDEAKKEKPEPKPEAKDEKPAKDDAKVADATPSQPENAAPAPEGPQQFGRIKENALKPHLKAIFAAYEEGKIPDTQFRVTVTCKVEPDGSLSNIRIVQSSGNAMIDDTALNLFREVGAMHALSPLAVLSSLSLTLERGASESKISAVGFSDDSAAIDTLTQQLQGAAWLARITARNADQQALLRQLEVSRSGNRISASIGLPNSRAGEMMRRSFGSPEAAPAPPKPTA